MNFNSFIFPAPVEDKKELLIKYKNELIFIPRNTKIDNQKSNNLDNLNFEYIPCLYLQSKKKPETNKFLFYFHGNAEDIFNSVTNLDLLKNILPYNIVSIEYPGYSLYFADKSAKTIEDDSLIVYDFFTKILKVNPKDIVIIGRSIGTGPACYLSANRDPAALVLFSPFTSIKETTQSILGIFNFIIADRFRNIDVISKVTCPLLLIHGQMDTLISFNHSIELSKKTSGPYELILPEEMDHNEYLIYDDFIDPICSFFKRHNLLNDSYGEEIELPKELFLIPDFLVKIKEIKQTDSVSEFLRKFMSV